MEMMELLETYPKTTIVVKQWLLEKMLENIRDSDVPEDFKEKMMAQSIDNDKVSKILGSNPRALLDVFDDHKVFIQINVNTPFFSYSINEGDIISGSWETRIGAEKAAIEQAFKMLNDKI